MHNEACSLLNLDYVYTAFDVAPEDFKTAVEGLKALGAVGFNVTMPGKTILYELSDTLSDAAKLSQSVNTVLLKNNKIYGYSTDGIGYMRSLKEAGHDIIAQKMTLLGAGGAATAICVQAALDGVKEIDLFRRKSAKWNTTLAFADQLTSQTNCRVNVYDLDDNSSLKSSIKDSAILTNATSVGMIPNEQNCLIPDSSFLHDGLIVSDIIYNPRETRLMKLGKQAGCMTINGLQMLLYQGAASFELFTNHQMPVEKIKEKFFKS